MKQVVRSGKGSRLPKYAGNTEKQAAFRARQIAKGMQLVWVSRVHLAAARALDCSAIGGTK